MNRERQREHERAYYWRNVDAVRDRKAEQMRQRRLKYPDTFRQQGMTYRQAMRQRLLDMYGAVCAICGFDDRRALTLDHIEGNGNAERIELGERGVYRKALSEHQPCTYRTLCMNCQFIENESRSKRRSRGESSPGAPDA